MTSSCLGQFRGWKIPILVSVWRGHSGLSRRLNGVISYKCKLYKLMDISISARSSFHLKFSHHISAPWSETHLVRYSSIWGSLSWSSILYYDVNYLIFNIINLSGINSKKYRVLFLNNEETMSFPHYLVVNSCNINGSKWMYKLLMIYEWIDCN